MARGLAAASAFGLVLSLTLLPAVAAHEGGAAKIEVEPPAVTAGASVIITGSGLEEDSERVLVLSGADLIVQFGTVTTDADGTFQKELTIPSHLPPGTYEFQAIGDETLTVPFGILEAGPAGATPMPMPSMGPGGMSTAGPGPVDPTNTVIARERGVLEMGLIGLIVLLAAAAGAFLVVRAEKLGAFLRARE